MFGDNMFGDTEVFGAGEAFGAGIESNRDRTVMAIQLASSDRLAELVHHLSDVPFSEARRAIRIAGPTRHHDDPLSIVAAALIQLRRNSHRCIGV